MTRFLTWNAACSTAFIQDFPWHVAAARYANEKRTVNTIAIKQMNSKSQLNRSSDSLEKPAVSRRNSIPPRRPRQCISRLQGSKVIPEVLHTPTTPAAAPPNSILTLAGVVRVSPISAAPDATVEETVSIPPAWICCSPERGSTETWTTSTSWPSLHCVWLICRFLLVELGVCWY